MTTVVVILIIMLVLLMFLGAFGGSLRYKESYETMGETIVQPIEEVPQNISIPLQSEPQPEMVHSQSKETYQQEQEENFEIEPYDNSSHAPY